MLKLQTTYKLPNKTYLAVLTRLVLLLLGISLVFYIPFSKSMPFINLFIIFGVIFGIPAFLIAALKISSASFLINENSITINSGIVIKQSKSIPFNTVQNVSCKAGPVLAQFNLSSVEIWTTSPSQLTIRNGRSDASPTSVLTLEKDDARWLKDLITNSKTTNVI